MNRRGFLASILAAGLAPALVKAANLMPVRQLASGLFVPAVDEATGLFVPATEFLVPSDVSMVWLTMVGGGGGGSSRMISPCENDVGECFNKPIAVTPGQVLRIEIGSKKEAIVQWVDGGTLNSQFYGPINNT